MKYTISKEVFELNPEIKFGILIGHNIRNSETSAADTERLRSAEDKMRQEVKPEQLRELNNITLYRDVMMKSGINPNKYPPSVEAMFKRIIKGGQLPAINALVDLCNAVSVENTLSLGGHDLRDIHDDLEVRFSRQGDVFLPFGSQDYEVVPEGELVFTSGNTVQTLKWVWRQSELGKLTLDSRDVFFQLVGFEYGDGTPLTSAMNEIEKLINERFQGECVSYLVDINNPSVEFI